MVSSGLWDNAVYVAGSDDISRCIKDKLNIVSGETSACQKFSLLEVECLGACVNGPILQVNDDFYEDMDYQATAEILDELALDNKPKFGSVIGRQGSRIQKVGRQHSKL